MAIARSLAIAAESNEAKRIAAYQAYRAKRDSGRAIRETLSAFVNGISAAASAKLLQMEQAVSARRDDGLPIADDQLSGAARWETLANSGKRRANEASGAAAHDACDFGSHLDCASDDEADGADATYYHAMPNTIVVIDDAGNAEKTTLHVIGSARIVEREAGVSTTVYVTLKRETEHDGSPVVVHLNPSAIAHATLLSACERISRHAWKADRIEAIPDQMKIWCSVGRYAGTSDAPGWAYTGWAWLGFDRASELTKQAKIRGSKKAPLHRKDVSRVASSTIVASQVSESDRASESAREWPIGHGPSLAIAESAVNRVIRERKESRKSSKVRILDPANF